jgi:hypothetical protein
MGTAEKLKLDALEMKAISGTINYILKTVLHEVRKLLPVFN